MKNLPWFLAAVGIGLAAYVVMNTPGPEYSTGVDSVEDAARGTARWGSKARIGGAGNRVAGKVKEAFGNATGNPDLADEGLGDQIVGHVQDAAGSLAQAAGQTLHDFNR
jgi:uncharacterized protein YjbJ (UPF0337 family)